jgi:hypothetical protein
MQNSELPRMIAADPNPSIKSIYSVFWKPTASSRVKSFFSFNRSSAAVIPRTTLRLWRTQETPFQSTSYVKTVDAIRVSSESSDYVITSRSKDKAVTLIILQREHHDTILLQMIMWVMSIMALSTSGMISSSIGCNAP